MNTPSSPSFLFLFHNYNLGNCILSLVHNNIHCIPFLCLIHKVHCIPCLARMIRCIPFLCLVHNNIRCIPFLCLVHKVHCILYLAHMVRCIPSLCLVHTVHYNPCLVHMNTPSYPSFLFLFH